MDGDKYLRFLKLFVGVGEVPEKIGWGCAAGFPKPLNCLRTKLPKSAIFSFSRT